MKDKIEMKEVEEGENSKEKQIKKRSVWKRTREGRERQEKIHRENRAGKGVEVRHWHPQTFWDSSDERFSRSERRDADLP